MAGNQTVTLKGDPTQRRNSDASSKTCRIIERTPYLQKGMHHMHKSHCVVLAIIAAVVGSVGFVVLHGQQKKNALTPQDYIEIQQLVARYPYKHLMAVSSRKGVRGFVYGQWRIPSTNGPGVARPRRTSHDREQEPGDAKRTWSLHHESRD